VLAELAFRITAQGAYAREFGNLRKEIAQLDSGMSTIARTARITQLSIGALGAAFAGGLGARAVVAIWRLVTNSIKDAASGATTFGGIVTSDMVPRLNLAAQAFKGIENAIGGLIVRVADGLVKLGIAVGLVDDTAAKVASKYGRVLGEDPQGDKAALDALQGALADKVNRDALSLSKYGRIGEAPDPLDSLREGLAARAEFEATRIEAANARIKKSLADKGAVEKKSLDDGAAASTAAASAIDTVNTALDAQIAKLGMSAEQQRIFDQLQLAGVSATSAAGQAIAAKVHTLVAYEDALAATNARLQEFRSFAGSALNTFTGALQQGKTIAEAFRDSWVSALGTIIQKINEAAAAALASSLFGGGAGAGIGGVLTSIGSFLGFAGGGSFTVGGTGGPDSQLVPLRLTPGEVVNISKGEGGQSQQPVQVVVKVDPNRYFDAHVAQVSAPVAQRAAVSAVGAYDKATRRARETAG